MSDALGADVRDGATLEERLAQLSPEKRAALEKRLLQRKTPHEAAPDIVRRDREGPVSLSLVQELMWLVHEMDPGSHTYNSSGARRMRGRLDVDALQRAIDLVTERHSSLRTTFEQRDGVPVQIINDDTRVAIEYVAAPGVAGEELLELLRDLVRRPFDLTVAPLMRVTLVELGPDDHVLMTSANHIVWDGWSKGIWFSEVATAYQAFVAARSVELPELPLEYADFAVWQREWLAGERMERQLAYWRGVLSGAPALLELPTDRPRPAIATHRGGRVELWLSEEELAGLHALARQHGVTLFMLLVAAWSTLLHRFAGLDDIVLGTPVAGRNRVEVERMIGYFNNTLALRVDCSDAPTFVELLARVREVAVGAYANQDVSFEHVVREVAPHRDLSYSPIFQSLIVLQNAAPEKLKLQDLDVEMMVTESGTAKFDLSLGMGEHEGRLHASFEYNTDLFDRSTAERVRGQFQTLVTGLLDDADRRLSQLPLMSDDDRDALGATAYGPRTAIPDATLHGLFAQQAARAPDRIAVTSAAGELTYDELSRRAAAMAQELGRRGVGAGSCVGICLDRSSDLLVTILGTLHAGAACVPLDADYPEDRLRAMVEDAGLDFVVVDAVHASLVEQLGVEPVGVPDSLAEEGLVAEPSPAAPTDPAYVIFTSGSTGSPKGVVLEHRGLVNHALAASDLFDISETDRILQFSSVSFDISLEEIFCALFNGAALVLRGDDMPLGGPGLTDWLEHHRVTVMDLPTAFWHEWVRDLAGREASPHAALRCVIVGGEKASTEALETWRPLAPGVRWINTYGPTEASVVATAFEPPSEWRCEPGRELPIGSPLPNVDVHLLDANGAPAPVGVPGELYLGGAGVARGYLERPDATAEAFPDRPGIGRVYRTGDLARRRSDGLLEFIGRADAQIKLRGFRIEPAEVEAALLEHDAVASALVVLDEKEDPLLVAYLVGKDGAPEIDTTAARSFAAERLPAFAVPSAFVTLDALPLTPNGKIDRDELPAPVVEVAEQGRVEPADETERVLVAVWADLLGAEVGCTDDFFELGGHSMLAVRMLTQVERDLGVRVRLAAMVRAPTIRGLAEVIRDDRGERTWRPLVSMKPDGERPALFLMHALEGEVLIYRDLVRRLDADQPAWGLEAVGADGVQVPEMSIPSMATLYINEIRTVQPTGPYLLAGLCYGGVLAHEMAHQLEEAGEDVAFVGLIDAKPFGLRKKMSVSARLGRRVREFRAASVEERVEVLRLTARNVWHRTRKQARWHFAKWVYIDRGRGVPASMQVMTDMTEAAATGYRSPRYGGRVTLIRVIGSVDQVGPEDVRLRWREFADGGVDVYDVGAEGVTHTVALFEPHVGQLAEVLETAISESLAERAS